MSVADFRIPHAMNILSEYLRYRKSKHKQAYKEIGKQYRVSGFYVYRIAHGKDLGEEFDEDIRFDLNEKRIIKLREIEE